MKNKELQELLRQFPDDLPIHFNHPDGDWEMAPRSVIKYDDNEYVLIKTDFTEDDE